MGDKKVTLENGKTIGKFLDMVIAESVRAAKARVRVTEGPRAQLETDTIKEKEKQDLFGDEESDAEPTKSNRPEDQGDAKPHTVIDPPKDRDDKEALESGDVDITDIIEKFNAVRAGKSFRDDDIKTALTDYFEKLTKAERVAFFALLKGAAEIVTGEFGGDEAMDPSDPEPNVAMKKGKPGESPTAKVKHVEPNVIKKQPEGKKEKSEEDTTAPVPIKPKEK